MLPETGFIRLKDIIGDRRRTDRLPLLPISKSVWWQGVRQGRFPPPVKLGPHTTAWRAEDIRALIAKLSDGEAS
jgi:predicted DNA-binding transcriptional regulator AlpA